VVSSAPEREQSASLDFVVYRERFERALRRPGELVDDLALLQLRGHRRTGAGIFLAFAPE
jgi:hypothetical protein